MMKTLRRRNFIGDLIPGAKMIRKSGEEKQALFFANVKNRYGHTRRKTQER